MKRTTLIIAGMAIAAIGAAQSTNPFRAPSNIAFRLGWVFPIDDVLDARANNLIGVGADWFLERPLLPEGESSISFDILAKSSSGAKTNIFPILLNHRWYSGPENELGGGRSYWFAGAGIAIVDVISTDTVWAVRGGLGKEFGPNIFGEVTFLYTDDAKGARGTSIGAYIGYRF